MPIYDQGGWTTIGKLVEAAQRQSHLTDTSNNNNMDRIRLYTAELWYNDNDNAEDIDGVLAQDDIPAVYP
jgi:hypothetical protein